MAEKEETIVIFPFMMQGHIIPFFALAEQIERKNKNYRIVFVNTPQNIRRLRGSLPSHSSIQLHEIGLWSSDYGLPHGHENSDTLPYHLVIRLMEASTSLKPNFRKLIEDLNAGENGRRPLCIIADIFFGWTATLAKELGIFHVIFSGAGGFGLAVYYSLWMNLPHRKTTSDDFLLLDFPEASKIHRTQLPANISEATGEDSWSVFMRENLSAWVDSNGVLLNTVEKLDELGLTYFKRKLGREVWPIGPVVWETEHGARAGRKSGIAPESCRQWLDKKPVGSVLYVAFGSMNTISSSQMMELAMALDGMSKNFIWVVRPPVGNDITLDFNAEKWLPNGFEERTKHSGKGLIVKEWAPQMQILSHKSVSAFLSHCGWNSVLEALSNGIPIIGWPMAAEQFFNAKLLQEKTGVCVEAARGKNCEISHERLIEKIETVMGESEKGKEMRRKAGEVKEIIKTAKNEDTINGFKGSSIRFLDDFLASAKTMTDKNRISANFINPY